MTKFDRTLMVVDDDHEMHQGLRMFLDEYDIKSFLSGEDAIEAAREDHFPAVVLDLYLGGMSGLDTLKKLKELCPQQQVIILTGHASTENAIEAVNLGAFRYLTKPLRIFEFRETVSQAFESFEREIARTGRTDFSLAEIQSLGLTDRQAKICSLVIKGQSNSEIVRTLERSPRTIEKHLERILTTLKISSRAKIIQKLQDSFRSAHRPTTT